LLRQRPNRERIAQSITRSGEALVIAQQIVKLPELHGVIEQAEPMQHFPRYSVIGALHQQFNCAEPNNRLKRIPVCWASRLWMLYGSQWEITIGDPEN
jgi:hypothetical protein